MTFYKTTAAFGVTACLLMASTAFGAALESQTFSSDEGNWVGDTNRVVDTTVVGVAPAGLPISASVGEGNKVLEISGSASNVYTSAQSDTLVDMMVKVSIPDEALSGLDATGAKFAVAVDKTNVSEVVKGVFKYWDATANSNAGGWVALSATPYAADEWVRVTMKFYYSTGKCVVALNGNPCGECPLIANATTLASIEVKGSTALDEVLVTQDTMVAAFSGHSAKIPAAGGGDSIVTKEWLTAFNKTWPDSASADLVSQYTLGLDPNGTATTMPLSFEQDTLPGKATFSFPGFGAYGGTGTYVLQTSSDNSAWSGSTVVAAGANGVTTTQVDLPTTAGAAVYYRILAQPASN